MIMKHVALTCVLLLLLAACAVPAPRAAVPDPLATVTPQAPVTATPAPPGTRPTLTPPQPLTALPTASPEERQAASNTWLYLLAFQSGAVSVIDPRSGHALYTIPTEGDRAGMAVAPDGVRLYVVDGLQAGRLRVFDTATWEVIHQEPVAKRARMFINPITLSGDGRWLVVRHYDYDREQAWTSVFDTRRLAFLPDGTWSLTDCSDNILLVGLLGRPDHERLYAECGNSVIALDADTLEPLWETPAPLSPHPDLDLASDGRLLFGLYPQVQTRVGSNGHRRATETDLRLIVWGTQAGHRVHDIALSEQVTVPPATIGRGDAGYLAITPDGERLYVAWEDRLWALSTESLKVVAELDLPAPVDGMALSPDGRALYLLPATAGDLKVRGHGLWSVDATALELVRRTPDWPENLNLFAADLVAASAPNR